MTARHLLALPALLALAACGGSTDAVRPLPAPPPPKSIRPASPAVIQTQRPKAHLQVLPGLEGVIGADADALTRQFGQPRLEVQGELGAHGFGSESTHSMSAFAFLSSSARSTPKSI